MYKLLKYFIVLMLLIFVTEVKASHIMGGEFTYVCLADGQYEITLIVYRNCNSQSQDFLDNPAPITIYLGNEEPYQEAQHHYVPVTTVIDIPITADPCQDIPADICVQQGTYIFQVNLPDTTASYHITYQRCCRNAATVNIPLPDDTGASYSIELTELSQQLDNNSPTFDAYPPLIICANQELLYDHSAIDAEGDQLVYELCAPLEGAGLIGTNGFPGDETACDGYKPDPACPPPYTPLTFNVPDYTAINPLGGNPLVGIDPATGQFFGVPEIIGQFVVGICVSEYRDGQLLSVVRRDFQFNVTLCEPLVLAWMESDEVIGQDTFLFSACSDSTFNFINQSTQAQYIETNEWEFDLGNGQLFISADEDISLTFPGYGTYFGHLFLNREYQCKDSAFIQVDVYEGPTADFDITYDSCVAGPVSFFNTSQSPNPIVSYDWNLGNGIALMEENPMYLFEDAGFKDIVLTVLDTNDCVGQIDETISWFPAPPIIIFEPSTFDDCAPLAVYFNNLSSPIDTTYAISWDFGDGQFSSEISPNHIYQDPGNYSLAIEIISPIGCSISDSFPNWITAHDLPVADFSYSPNPPTNFQPFVDFVDESIDAHAWFWEFAETDFSYLENPSYTFADTGMQVIQLIVSNQENCKDTILQYIDIVPQITYFLPNAFTPNGDGINDGFSGGGYFKGMKEFQLMIWNRWGELVFETNNPSEIWNGQKNNIGKDAPMGVYVCRVKMTGPRGKPSELEGFVTLVR